MQRDVIFTLLSIHFSVTEPNFNTSHGHSTQVAPGVFVETFNLPVQNQNEGVPPEINRVFFKSEDKGGTFCGVVLHMLV